jgi:hypothetical protein
MEYPSTPGTFCARPPKNTSFFINVVIHIAILLTIVSSFFFFYVSKLSRDKFKDELEDLINQNLSPAIQKADSNGVIKETLKQLDLNRITKYYKNKTDTAMSIQNKWLFRVTLLAIVMLVFTVILSVIILRQACGQCAPFTQILKENIILFTFVGFMEVSFFLTVARNFVPSKPSLMMSTIVESLKANF